MAELPVCLLQRALDSVRREPNVYRKRGLCLAFADQPKHRVESEISPCKIVGCSQLDRDLRNDRLSCIPRVTELLSNPEERAPNKYLAPSKEDAYDENPAALDLPKRGEA